MTLNQIQQETFHDENINWKKTHILEKDKRATDVFSPCDDELFYRERVVIPWTLEKLILIDFHAGHPG